MHVDCNAGRFEQHRQSVVELRPTLHDFDDTFHNILLNLSEDGGTLLLFEEYMQRQPVFLRGRQE